MLRSQRSVEAENLFLRRQLALYKERGVTPRRIDPATRIALAVLSRFFNWRDALIVVRPETLIRWHRAGWKLLWRLKTRPGRPAIPLEIQRLIRRMANENPSWGEERIANELLLKLGIRVSPRTVNKYLPPRPTHHRVAKARRNGVPVVYARRIACPRHVPFLTSTAAYEKYVEYWNSKVKEMRHQSAMQPAVRTRY